MRIKAGSTVLIPKSSRVSGDVSPTLAENASLSLEKPVPPPPASKCVKPANNANGSKGAQQNKCAPVKQAKKIEKTNSKGNSSQNNAASQHKSASTDLAKSAKNRRPSNPINKGVNVKQ
jgi:membrane-bound lytic murein transglycosylase D